MDVNFKAFGFEIYLENIAQFQENKSSSKGGFANNPYQMVERDFAFLLLMLFTYKNQIFKYCPHRCRLFFVYQTDPYL